MHDAKPRTHSNAAHSIRYYCSQTAEAIKKTRRENP